MPTVFLSLFALAAVVLVGCDQDDPVAVENQTNSPKKINEQPESHVDANLQMISLATAKYSYQGKLYDRDEVQKVFKKSQSHFMFIDAGSPEANVVHIFDSDADFQVWANETLIVENFSESNKAQRAGDHESFAKSAAPQAATGSGGGATLYNATYTGKNRYYSAQKDFSFLGDFSYLTSSVQVHCAKANSPVSCKLYDEKGRLIVWIYNSRAQNSYGVDLHGVPTNNQACWVEVYYGF